MEASSFSPSSRLARPADRWGARQFSLLCRFFSIPRFSLQCECNLSSIQCKSQLKAAKGQECQDYLEVYMTLAISTLGN